MLKLYGLMNDYWLWVHKLSDLNDIDSMHTFIGLVFFLQKNDLLILYRYIYIDIFSMKI